MKEAGKYTDYKAKKAAFNLANTTYRALKLVPVDADPRILALVGARETAMAVLRTAEKATQTFPVDADPAIVSLALARTTALGALDVAKAGVHVGDKATVGAGRVSAWAAKHNGDLFMLDEVKFAADLGGYLAGNQVTLQAKVRFLGEKKSLKLKVSPQLIADGKLATALWDQLKKGLQG